MALPNLPKIGITLSIIEAHCPMPNIQTQYCTYNMCTVSTNSDKFPDIFGGSDANLYIWKNFLIYKVKSDKFGNFS